MLRRKQLCLTAQPVRTTLLCCCARPSLDVAALCRLQKCSAGHGILGEPATGLVAEHVDAWQIAASVSMISGWQKVPCLGLILQGKAYRCSHSDAV